MTKITILEDVRQSGTPFKVDREKRIISGVKLCGMTSRNGADYPATTLRKAVPLYEGLECNVDHVDRKNLNAERKVKDRFGKYRNARFVEGEGIFADLHYLEKHPDAPLILEAAESMPDAMGFSHQACGNSKKSGDKTLVSSIDSVRSVDIVANPATTNGFFESHNLEAVMADPAAPKSVDELFDDLQSAVMKEDGTDLTFLKKVMKLREQRNGTAVSEEATAEEGEGEGDTQESEEVKEDRKKHRLMEAELKTFKKKELARSLCAVAKIDAVPELIEAMIAQPDEEKMKNLLDWAAKNAKPAAKRQIRSSGGYQLRESEAPEVKIPTDDIDKLADHLRIKH